MSRLVPIDDLPRYPDELITQRHVDIKLRQGLIEPLGLRPDGHIIEDDRYHFEAFIRAAEQLGPDATSTVLIYDTDEYGNEL